MTLMTRRPSIRQLECFLAVAEELNFRRAAERLFISQPPLSRQIAALEKTLEVVLLRRDTHGVELTEAGRNFAGAARKALALLDNAVREAEVKRGIEPRHLRIGITSTVDPGAIPSPQTVLKRNRVAANADLSYGMTKQLLVQVKNGALDLAVAGFPSRLPPGLETVPLFSDFMFAVLPSGHPAASGTRRLGFSDLACDRLHWFRRSDNPPFYDMAEEVFSAHDYRPARLREPEDTNLLLASVASGRGIAFLPSSFAAVHRPGVVYRRLTPDIEACFAVELKLVRRAGEKRAVVLAAWTVLAKELNKRPRVKR